MAEVAPPNKREIVSPKSVSLGSNYFFTQGSHKDDVIRLQGTPDSIQRYEPLGYEVWEYGDAKVEISIRDGRVLKWDNVGKFGQ